MAGAMKKKGIARCLYVLLYLLLLLGGTMSVSAGNGDINWDTAYSYNYDVNKKSIQTPAFYQIKGESDAVCAGATDMVIHQDALYVLDPTRARIAVFDLHTLALRGEIVSQEADLTDARGLHIAANGDVYVTLYTQKTIVVLNMDGKVLQSIGEPQSEAVSDTFEYKPTRIVVQEDGQSGERLLYVVSEGAYDGLIQLDGDGNFISFFGSNTVELTVAQALQRFWNNLFTDAMKDRTTLALPANYSSVTLSPDGFVYVCTESGDVTTGQVKRLSPYGTNITNTAGGDVYGDLEKAKVDGFDTTNTFIDLTVDEDGTVSVLDSFTGRIFQYDDESHLLGVFGGLGDRAGLFKKPVAIANVGATLYVLDRERGRIYEYEPTDYGALIHTSLQLLDDGQENEAVSLLQEIDRQCSGLEWVNRALGKAALIEKNYQTGMTYFKAAKDVENYSECFEMFRATLMEKYFWLLFTGIVAVFVVAWILMSRSMKKEAPAATALSQKAITPFHLLAHPTAFGVMKEENRGSLWMACGVLGLTMLTRILSISSTGFIFRPEGDAAVNYPLEMLQIVLLFLCFIGCSWAVGTFLDGKGRLKELLIASAYALMPYCLCSLLSTGLSNVLSLREEAFVTGLQMIGLYWSVMLMFLAMMRTNQYSFSKTVVSLLFTVVAIVFILFTLIMMFTLVSKITGFVGQVWEEYQYKFR